MQTQSSAEFHRCNIVTCSRARQLVALLLLHLPYTVTSLTSTATPVIASSRVSHLHKCLVNVILMWWNRHHEGSLHFSQRAVDDAKELILGKKRIYNSNKFSPTTILSVGMQEDKVNRDCVNHAKMQLHSEAW